MSIRKLVIYIAVIIFSIAAGFIVFTIHMLELTEITKSEQRVGFVRLITGEDVSEDVLKSLYLGLRADHCGFIKDKESIIFRYTLQPELISAISSIEELFGSSLKGQHIELSTSCNSQ